MLSRLEGYLLIPHELLHVVGYRLVGKRCIYRWGQPYVIPVGPLTRREHLVGLLFPFVVSATLFLVLTILSGVTLLVVKQQEGTIFLWLVLLGSLCLIVGGYAGAASGDLRQAYLLIYDKPEDSKTPFDFITWPTAPQPGWIPIFALLLALLATLALIFTL
jgi:hypothetical protein